MQGKATIGWEKTPLGVRYNLIKDLPNGNRMVRHAECIVPNMFIIPSIREPGTAPKRKQRGTELSWAVPIDNEHVRGMSIVAWPLENGEPKPDWKPGTDTIADIRPGSYLERSYEERQKKPDDLEAQEGQRPIAIHALENLAHSDTASSYCGGYCASNCGASKKASTRSTSFATHPRTSASRPAPGTRSCPRPRPPNCPTGKTSNERLPAGRGSSC